MIKNISNLGDAAIYCDFGKEVNKNINSNVISYFKHLQELVKEKNIEGITNLTPSYNKLIISFDLSITNYEKIKKILETLKIKKNNQQDSKKNTNSSLLRRIVCLRFNFIVKKIKSFIK